MDDDVRRAGRRRGWKWKVEDCEGTNGHIPECEKSSNRFQRGR